MMAMIAGDLALFLFGLELMTAGASPGGTSAPNEAARAESKQDLEELVKAWRKSN
jgi:hypothetical protein